jgi:hypothetical protein
MVFACHHDHAYIEAMTVTCIVNSDALSNDDLDVYLSRRSTDEQVHLASVGVTAGQTVDIPANGTAVEEWDSIVVYERELVADSYVASYPIVFSAPHAEFSSREELADTCSYSFTLRLGGLGATGETPTHSDPTYELRHRHCVIQSITATCTAQEDYTGSDTIDFYVCDLEGKQDFLGTIEISSGETKSVPLNDVTVMYSDHIWVYERDTGLDDPIALTMVDWDNAHFRFTSEADMTSATYTFDVQRSEWQSGS